MPINGLLGGYNEQRGADTNYLAQLEAMRRAQIGQQLEQERIRNQASQFGQTLTANQAQQATQNQLEQQRLAAQQSQFGQTFGLNQAAGQREQQLANLRLQEAKRGEQGRNALAQLLANGGDVSSIDLGKAILPYETGTGIGLIKAGKEEQRQQSLLDRTGGTGIQPERGYRWNAQGNQEPIPGGNADPRIIAQLEAIKAGAKGTKLTAEQQKIVDASNAGMATIDRAIKLSGENKDVFGQSRGLAENFPLIGGPSLVSLVGKYDSPEEQAARGAVFQEAATVAHELLGSAQSPSEKASVQTFLPSSSDNAQQIGVKLAGLKQLLQTKRDAILTGHQSTSNGEQSRMSANWQDHYQSKAQAVSDALEAVRKGVPRDAVAKRLKEIGIEDARI